MLVEASVTIRGPWPAIWTAITDIENAAALIRGIEKIEIVEKPAAGLVGLRWRETRMLFGKPATVEKRITQAVGFESYTTRAQDKGFVFITTTRISGSGSELTLTSFHESRPLRLAARLMSIPMSLFFEGVVKKAALQDLNDIKAAVERSRT